MPKKSQGSPYLNVKHYNHNYYGLSTTIQLAWLINKPALARALFGAWRFDDIFKMEKISFWEYNAHTLFLFFNRQIQEHDALYNLRGLQKYWVKYPTLMSLISSGRIDQITNMINDIEESFIGYNKNRSITSTGMVDPCKEHHFKWDFRLHAIINMGKNLYQLNVEL